MSVYYNSRIQYKYKQLPLTLVQQVVIFVLCYPLSCNYNTNVLPSYTHSLAEINSCGFVLEIYQ